MQHRHSFRIMFALAVAALGVVTGAFAQSPRPGAQPSPSVVVVDGPIQVDPTGVPPSLVTPPPSGTWESVELAGQSGGPCAEPSKVKGVIYATGNLQITKDGDLPCVDVGSTVNYYRGAGTFPTCQPGRTQGAFGLCYEACRPGFELVSGRCYKPCPAGFEPVSPTLSAKDKSSALVCRKPAAYGRGAGYPWKLGDDVGSLDEARARCRKDNPQGCEKEGQIIYPKCRTGYKAVGSNICSARCPAGMTDTGIDCAKESYTPASNPIQYCALGKEYVDGLCYENCRKGYSHSRGSPGYVCSRVLTAEDAK